MSEQPSPQDGAPLAWARAARLIALVAWALAALAPGAAAALAQYSSLTSGLHSPLYTVALLIVCLGVGLALLGWLFWVVVRVRLRRAGYRFGQSTVRGMLLALVGGITLLVMGAVLAAWGGNSDSLALPALLALGLGIAGVVGGVLGVLWSLGRLMVLDARESEESKARRELVDAWREQMLEEARRGGRDTAAMRRAGGWRLWLFWLELLGTVVGSLVLLGNALFVLPVASLLHLSAIGALVLMLVLSALLVFVSFHALLMEMLPATLAPVAAQRRYALSAATALTTAFLLIGILVDTGLPFLSLIPFLALLVLQPILRKRSGVSA